MNTISIHNLRNFPKPFVAHDTFIEEDNIIGSGTIDMLWIHTEYINEEYLKNNWTLISSPKDKKRKKKKNRSYSYVRKYKNKKDTNLCLYVSSNYENKPFFDRTKGHYVYKVSLNPTQYRSMNKVHRILKKLIDPENRRHQISRIDFSALIPEKFFPVSILFEYLYFPHKQKSVSFKSDDIEYEEGDISGFRFGSGEEVLSVYSIRLKLKKALQYEREKNKYENLFHKEETDFLKSQILDNKAQFSIFNDEVVNIELQVKTKKLHKLGFKHIEDLKKLPNYKPFTSFSFIDFYKIQPKRGKKEKISERNKKITQDFILYSKIRGFQSAKAFKERELSRNLNKKITNIMPLMLKNNMTINDILNKSFHEGMKRMF